jgi:Na+-transporting methylmalonyl-CoA/oxaloacetate decarboxylase gamma subunit
MLEALGQFLLGVGEIVAVLLVVAAFFFGITALQTRKERQALAPAPSKDAVESAPKEGGLSDEQVAAITIAVSDYVRSRRQPIKLGPRAHEPGSHLFASRWVAVGRSFQQQPWTRR